MSIKALLENAVANWDNLHKFGAISQATLYDDKLTLKQFNEALDWLLSHGAEWCDNAQQYAEIGEENSFHLWLGVPAIKLHCGFSFRGEHGEKMAAAIKKKLDK